MGAVDRLKVRLPILGRRKGRKLPNLGGRPGAGADRRRTLQRVLRNPSLLGGLIILALYVAVALYAMDRFRGSLDFVPSHVAVFSGFELPSRPTLTLWPFSFGSYPLGETGGFGLNVLEELVKGTPWDLTIFSSILIPSALIGMLLGAASGQAGGFVDYILMGATDVVLSVPPFVIGLLVFVTILPRLPPHLLLPVFILSMVAILWAPYARIVRAKAKSVSGQAFVEAAVAGGAGRGRVLFRHVLPNSLTAGLSQVPVSLSTVIALMTILPYISIFTSGSILSLVLVIPSVNFPEWTWVLVNGLLGWSVIAETNDWWGYVFPLAWIMLFAFGVTLLSRGLGEHLAPSS